jgi:hypothetical protein
MSRHSSAPPAKTAGPGVLFTYQGIDQGLSPVRTTRRQSTLDAGSTSGPPPDSEGGTAMTHLEGGDPARSLADYYPAWLDNLADDVILEGSAMDGAAQGREAVRAILVAIRTLYDHQEFNFVGPVGDNGWLEDYTAVVRGEPIGNITLVTRNAAGQAQHIVGNYRPRSTLLLLSRLVGEKLAGTAYAEHFIAGES